MYIQVILKLNQEEKRLSNKSLLSWKICTMWSLICHISFDGFLTEPFFCYVWYCVRSGNNFTKSISPLIYQTNSKVTIRSNPEKTAMKWTTELSPERISMIEGICQKSMEKFGYANYSNSQMTLTDILSKEPHWTKNVGGIFISIHQILG